MKRPREDPNEFVEEEHLRKYMNTRHHESSIIPGDVNTNVESWNNLSFIASDMGDFNISFPKVGNGEFNAYNGKYWLITGCDNASYLHGLEFINDKLVFYVRKYVAGKDSIEVYHTSYKILYYIAYKGTQVKRACIGRLFRKLIGNIKDYYPDTFRAICSYLRIEDIQDYKDNYHIIKR